MLHICFIGFFNIIILYIYIVVIILHRIVALYNKEDNWLLNTPINNTYIDHNNYSYIYTILDVGNHQFSKYILFLVLCTFLYFKTTKLIVKKMFCTDFFELIVIVNFHILDHTSVIIIHQITWHNTFVYLLKHQFAIN